MPSRHALACGIAAALAFPSLAAAQSSPPDAGSLLQQLEQPRVVPLPPRAAPLLPVPPPLLSISGPTVTLSGIRFAGNSLLGSAELTPVVAGFLNRPLSFAELRGAATAVASAYRQAGWIVRVYLPQQDLADSVVTIQIVEARLGKVRQQGEALRIDAERLRRIVETAQATGAPVGADALDRALLLANDLPGVAVAGRLAEGENQAETDLVLEVVDQPMLSGEVSVENTGARSTGAARIATGLAVNSPLGIGDQADALLMHARGTDYVRLAYALPVGSAGWRAGVHASHMSYKVVTPEFGLLDAKGTSTAVGALASYPLIRSRLKNLYVSVGLDGRRFDNSSVGVTTTRYETRAASVALYGNLFDDLGGGGTNSAKIGFVHGRVDLDGSPNQAADAATTRTAGTFDVLRISAARQQRLTDTFSLYAGLAGQLASKNLDSSEKFYLGGIGGVRAYPVSEAGGSEGAIVNLELRARLPASFNASGFYDWGTVRVNKHRESAGAAALNRYSLQGAGVSVGWVASFGLTIKATLARRIGSNPNATFSGNDQDGSLKMNRFWLQASLPF